MNRKQQKAGGEAAEMFDCFCQGLGPQATRLLKEFAPGEVTEHFRLARVEFLKGVRSLIDRRIAELSKDKSKRGAKVAVE